MKLLISTTLTILCLMSVVLAQQPGIENPAIDMEGYLRMANEAAAHRATHRVTEEEFIRMSRESGTIIFDARSRVKFDELHINGAINLSFSDITVESLQRVLPDRNARILIYCNNNFTGAEQAFPTKKITASLNLSTYISLFTYGYRNVYELGPLLDIKKTKLDFAGSLAATKAAEVTRN